MFSNNGVDLNCVQNYLRGAIFIRFARFCAKLGSPHSQKVGVRFMPSLISPNLPTKLDGNGHVLLALNPSCLQCLVGFSNRPNQKVTYVKI